LKTGLERWDFFVKKGWVPAMETPSDDIKRWSRVETLAFIGRTPLCKKLFANW
jgi:hypothetical protein